MLRTVLRIVFFNLATVGLCLVCSVGCEGQATLGDASCVEDGDCDTGAGWICQPHLQLCVASCSSNADCQGADVGVSLCYPGGFCATPGLDTTSLEIPVTHITSGPRSVSASSSTAFTFSATDTSLVRSFQCTLDQEAPVPCESPKNYTRLLDGLHTFRVQALAVSGAVEVPGPTQSWRVDTVPPDTSISSGPSATTTSTQVTIDFRAADGGSGVAGFFCAMDSATFTACSPPQRLTGLIPGPHFFRAYAADAAGNLDASPAEARWTVTLQP